jgi:hypothetical protein
MVMEPPQTVDVDRTVVHPDTLRHDRDAYRSPEVKHALVDGIEYVVHFS